MPRQHHGAGQPDGRGDGRDTVFFAAVWRPVPAGCGAELGRAGAARPALVAFGTGIGGQHGGRGLQLAGAPRQRKRIADWCSCGAGPGGGRAGGVDSLGAGADRPCAAGDHVRTSGPFTNPHGTWRTDVQLRYLARATGVCIGAAQYRTGAGVVMEWLCRRRTGARTRPGAYAGAGRRGRMSAQERRALLLLVAGFTVWSVAFVVLYGMQALGCAFGWGDWHRPMLIGAYLLSLLPLGWL